MKSPNIKEEGSYYTPPVLANFMVFHLLTEYKFKKDIKVLEPSSGDGVFFESFFNNEDFQDQFKLPEKIEISAVEINKDAMTELKNSTSRYLLKNKITANYYQQDFLDFHLQNEKKFDLVIGNPPYIKINYLSKDQITLCEAVHKRSNLSTKKIKNIWTSFLLGSAESLNENGVMCLVLPAELLQVIYAKELREYLKSNFQKIEIFTFNKLIFKGIEQDVIILVCARTQEPGVSFYHVTELDQLKIPNYVPEHANIHRTTLDKWTNYILTDGELRFLDKLKKDMKLEPIKGYCRATVGIVTAANDYFIINDEKARDYGLVATTKKIVQKSSFIGTSANFTDTDFEELKNAGKPAYFLAFDDEPLDALSASIKDYLKTGVERQIHQRYKCKLRNNWYSVPSVWSSEGFFTKRSNIFPKMIVNEADVLVTDAFYRVRMNEGLMIKDLVFSFYNSLTLVFAELEGRYYGGSVLELTPNEYKNLPIPYYSRVKKKDFKTLDTMLRDGANIMEILDFTDSIIFANYPNIKDSDVTRLRKIYRKLIQRRLKSHKLNF